MTKEFEISEKKYDQIINETKKLFLQRNEKYGNSWTEVRLSSLIDYIIMKYNRLNKMVDNIQLNKQKIKSDLHDTINYCVFALIHLEKK